MKRRKKHPLNALVDENISYVESLLFTGNVLGGKPLLDLLKEYLEKGPFDPIRNELVKHMARCFEALANLDGYIISMARTLPHGRIAQYERRKNRRGKGAKI